MRFEKFSVVAALALGASLASQAFAGLNASNHAEWDEDFYFNSFGGAAPAGSVEYSVGFSTLANTLDGRVLSNAAVTTNTVDSTVLTTINTHLFSGTDANLYKIQITNPAAFSASVPSTSLIIALFKSDGTGLAASIGGVADAVTGTNAGVTTPGLYYLGIANSGMNPENAAGQNIFGLTGVAGVFTPVTGDKVLATDPTIAWTLSTAPGLLSNTSFTAPSSTITLAGANFAVVPEPASLSVLGLSAAALLLRRKR
jgi:hypothetical protein